MSLLSYHDIVITKEDLATLNDSQWINDEIIAFYEEYLEHHKYARQPDPPMPELHAPHRHDTIARAASRLRIRYLKPSVVHLMTHTTADNPSTFLPHLPDDIDKEMLYFIPINNHNDPSQPNGGSHWSVLVYVKSLHLFFHLDSFNHFNRRPAKKAAHIFNMVFQEQFDQDMTMDNSHHTSHPSHALKHRHHHHRHEGSIHELHNLIEVEAPQQQNGFDCGLHVLVAIDTLASHFIAFYGHAHGHSDPLTAAHVEQWSTQMNVQDLKRMRCDLIQLIHSLATKC